MERTRMLFNRIAVRSFYALAVVSLSILGRASTAAQSTPETTAAAESNTATVQETSATESANDQEPEAAESAKSVRIDQLIEQLGSPSYRRRKAAEWELQQMGLAAFDQLRAIVRSSDHPVQVIHAADYILGSQNVIWWLESDSVDVKACLKDYSASGHQRRQASILQLGRIGSADALLALCRVVRYELSEYRSRSAALVLLEKLADRPEDLEEAVNSVRLALGDSDRFASAWLLRFAADIQTPETQWERWSNLPEWESQPEPDVTPQELHKQQFQFFTWLGGWLRQSGSPEQVIDAIGPRLLELVKPKAYMLQEFTLWCFAEEMPQLVQQLADRFPDEFLENGRLGYLLAESYLRAGDEERAVEVARVASDHILPPKEASRIVPNAATSAAANRLQIAERLELRGMYDWAETEYMLALEQDSPYDARVRTELSAFYWLGGQPGKAAGILRPLAERVLKFSSTQRKAADRQLLSKFHFFEALAQIKAGALSEAQDSLRKARELDTEDPEIVIAMKSADDGGEFHDFYVQCRDDLRDSYRSQVVEFEQLVARAVDRGQRKPNESNLAEVCNQLAWLLSNCEVHLEEAKRLSERSLELDPKDAAYLDTLARCYYAAGDLENAIQTQKRALELEPFDRQMQAQLAVFQKAHANQ